jgi:hypothetical protein
MVSTIDGQLGSGRTTQSDPLLRPADATASGSGPAWYASPGLWITLVLMGAVLAAAVLWIPSAGAAGGCGGG